jgi:hypothetical protein
VKNELTSLKKIRLAKNKSVGNYAKQKSIPEKNYVSEPFFTSKKMFWICLLISFLFYGNSIKNGYSLDDEYVTTTSKQKNELTEKGIFGIGKIFTSHSFIDGKQNYEYRPVSMYTFAIEWSLFQNNENRVHISHAINVILYFLVGILLFQMLQILFQGKASTLSAITTILFMIHPIHSEVVNSIKNRDELLSLIFALLASIQTFKWVDSKQVWRIFLACLFIMLSLLSKKSNLPFIVSIPLMMYFFRDLKLKTIGISFLILFSVKIGFNIFKNKLMGLNESTNRNFSYFENPLFDLGFIERIPMFFYTNLLYIEKLILPYPLSYYYGFDAIELVGFGDWRFYLGLIVMAIGLYFALKGFLKKTVLSFGILFFFFAIGGVANLLSPMVGIFAERFAFSASIGFCLVLVFLFSKWRNEEFQKNQFTFSIAWPIFLLIIPSLFYTVNRNLDWSSKKSLYLADIANVSKSAKANSLLGSEYQTEVMALQKEGSISYFELIQKVDSAIYFYDKSLEVFKNYESNTNNKGVLLYTFRYDYLDAYKEFKKSVGINDKYKEGFLNCMNSMAKMAEGFNDFLIVSPISNRSESASERDIHSFEKVYIDQKYYQAIAIIKQIEYNIREFYFKGNRNDLNIRIIQNCQNLQSLNGLLQEKNLANQVSMMLANNTIPVETSIKNIFIYFGELKKLILNDICLKSKVDVSKCQVILKELKKNYIGKAKLYYKKTKEVSSSEKELFPIVIQFAKITQDYNWLAEIQLEYIKEYPNEYLGPNYSELINAYVMSGNSTMASNYCKKSIEVEEEFILKMKNKFLGESYVRMANAYLTLKENQKAIANFKKGATEFKREREFLNKKSTRTDVDNQRIEMLNRELQKLKQFKESLIKNGDLK